MASGNSSLTPSAVFDANGRTLGFLQRPLPALAVPEMEPFPPALPWSSGPWYGTPTHGRLDPAHGLPLLTGTSGAYFSPQEANGLRLTPSISSSYTATENHNTGPDSQPQDSAAPSTKKSCPRCSPKNEVSQLLTTPAHLSLLLPVSTSPCFSYLPPRNVAFQTAEHNVRIANGRTLHFGRRRLSYSN